MHREVIIVGGGPAGSSTAYHLSMKGVDVLLMEKAQFPREKVCGDGVSPRTVRKLYDMGLRERIDGNYQKVDAFKIAYMSRWVMENEIPLVPGYPRYGYTIRRVELDKMLLDHARESGAEVWENCRVDAPLTEHGRVCGVRADRRGEEMEVTADVVVGADGAHSTLGRAMGLLIDNPWYTGVAVRRYLKGFDNEGNPQRALTEFVAGPCMGWLFPVSESVANVGIGTVRYHINNRKLNLSRVFDKYITETAHIAPTLRNAEPMTPLKGGLLRLGLGASRVECPGLILVGDAASLVSPFTGEGIGTALESGEMAARHILESREGGSKLSHDPSRRPFLRVLKKRYGLYFRFGSLQFRIGGRTPLMRPFEALAFYLPSKIQFMSDMFVKVTMDLIGHRPTGTLTGGAAEGRD